LLSRRFEPVLSHEVGLLKTPFHISSPNFEIVRHVLSQDIHFRRRHGADLIFGQVLMNHHRAIRFEGLLGVENRRKFLVFDFYQIDRFLGCVFVNSCDCRNRLPNESDLVSGKQRLVVESSAVSSVGQVFVRDDSPYARQSLGFACVYPDDLCVRR
jgi:hypothetical protein